jgi:hypothetical protein
MSNVVKLDRIFREKLELDDHPVGSPQHGIFKIEHVCERGRRVVGNHSDVPAFAAARAWRDRGVRVVAVERGRP